jgi:hypothetical protein
VIGKKTQLLGNIMMIGVSIVFVSQLCGCAAGYYSFTADVPKNAMPAVDLSSASVIYHVKAYVHDAVGAPDIMLREINLLQGFFASSLARHFHYSERAVTADTGEYMQPFVINAQLQAEMSLPHTVWALVGVISLATIPAMIEKDGTVTCVITAPDGDQKTYQYRWTERSLSWLPFMVFSPDFWSIWLAGTPGDNERRIKLSKTMDEIASQMVVDLGPFIESHSNRRM